MSVVKKYFQPVYLIIVFFVIFFRKTIFEGLIPIPFNLLVQWYFPYNHGGWQTSKTFIQIKGGQFASDAIRQIYPWKELAIEMIKNHSLPLWNPYTFSGTPLLANMQTAVFYPLNIIFILISSFSWAWTLLVALPILFSGLLMYKFLTSLKIEKLSAVFAALAFSSSGYMVCWLEWGVIPHVMMWLPLSLLALKLWSETLKKKYLLPLIFSLTSTILAGYPQGTAYSMLIVGVYFFFLIQKSKKSKSKNFLFPVLFTFILTIGISAVQWIPTAELYFQSAMKGEVSQNLSRKAAMPLPHFATLLAPDYFGNRVTENYWAKEFSGLDYMDADLFVGASLLPFALFALLAKKKIKEVKWFIWILILGIALGSKSPISVFIANSGIPVLGTGAAAEALVMLIFSLSCLGAIGLSQINEKSSKKRLVYSYAIIAFLFLLLIVATFFFSPEKTVISRRNLIIPLTAFIASATAVLQSTKFKIKKKVLRLSLILVLATELLFHANKILPFSTPKHAFPDHILISKLKNISQFNRVAGFWETEIATNFHTAFRLYSAEGYDPLYLRRYGEFVTSAAEGILTKDIPRSDADLTMENETNRNRLLDLTSTKFIAAKVTDSNQLWEQESLKYNPERFKLIWQESGFKIYENLKALPRINFFSNWTVSNNDEEIIRKLYAPDFDYQNQLILEKNPNLETSDTNSGEAKILKYQPLEVIIETNNNQSAVLLLTDSYYQGWRAVVDNNPTEIIRANYSFRAVAVPRGKHTVSFTYQPQSFQIGKTISIVSLMLAFFLYKILPINRKHLKE